MNMFTDYLHCETGRGGLSSCVLFIYARFSPSERVYCASALEVVRMPISDQVVLAKRWELLKRRSILDADVARDTWFTHNEMMTY